jgi:hypothetical protein
MWHAWERGETCTGFWWERPKKKDHLQDQGVDGRMGPQDDWLGRCGVDLPGLGYGSLAGCCECGDEPSGSGTTELVGYKYEIVHLRTC